MLVMICDYPAVWRSNEPRDSVELCRLSFRDVVLTVDDWDRDETWIHVMTTDLIVGWIAKSHVCVVQ